MAEPRLVFGGTLGALLAPDASAFADDDVDYAVLALTNKSAPAGPGGECIFPTLYLTTKRFADVALTVTAIVDGVALTPHTVTLAGAAAADGTVDVTEVDLGEPYPSADDEQIRNDPRGSSIQVLIEADVAGAAEVTVCQVEYEPVRETRTA